VDIPTVIVVEDDPFVRDLAAAMLEETDLRVVEAVSAEEALSYLREHGPDVRMVFADLWLAGRLDGVDLARTISNRWPWIKVVVTSGNPGDRLRELPRNAEYMQKPWRALDVLMQAERAATKQGHA
jgi:CheY-like chemotaxis protein